jgi:hypothetical protein
MNEVSVDYIPKEGDRVAEIVAREDEAVSYDLDRRDVEEGDKIEELARRFVA